jgi:hypothetical protein
MAMLRLLSLGSLLASVAACNDARPISPTGPSSTTPSPPANPHQVSGVVSEIVNGVSRPLAGRRVDLWIWRGDGGYAHVATADDNGRYTAQVPTSRVYVAGWQWTQLIPGTGDMSLEIELKR